MKRLMPLLFVAATALAQVEVKTEHNSRAAATPEFRFHSVPSPSRDDLGSKAKISIIVGRGDGNSAPPSALIDGELPRTEDEPASNFFFGAGSDGGRILIDLGSMQPLAQVNTYSWHSDDRAPQVYNVYASDGTDAHFCAAPDGHTHPASCGWKLLASVDTRPQRGEWGGQYGVSISDEHGSLGNYRYLLFDSIPTEDDDPFGNTFFSEIDVVAADASSRSSTEPRK